MIDVIVGSKFLGKLICGILLGLVALLLTVEKGWAATPPIKRLTPIEPCSLVVVDPETLVAGLDTRFPEWHPEYFFYDRELRRWWTCGGENLSKMKVVFTAADILEMSEPPKQAALLFRGNDVDLRDGTPVAMLEIWTIPLQPLSPRAAQRLRAAARNHDEKVFLVGHILSITKKGGWPEKPLVDLLSVRIDVNQIVDHRRVINLGVG